MIRWTTIVACTLSMSGVTLNACQSSTSTHSATGSKAATRSQGVHTEPSQETDSPRQGQESTRPKPTHRTVSGEGYSLRLPIDGWSVIDKPNANTFPAGAIVGLEDNDGCRGAIVLTKRREGEKLETAKMRIVKSLELKELQTVFETRMLYNSKTAYQYNVRGERQDNDDLKVLRYQGTFMRDRTWFVEVRAWSERSFEPARSCHDTVTASFTNMGLGKLYEQNKNGLVQ